MAQQLVWAESSWRVLASAVSPSGGTTLGILGSSDSMVAARQFCRAVRGVPAAPFYGWMVAHAIGVGGFARDKRRMLSKIIERLKQAGEGARGVFKGGACACRLKFRKQMTLS